MNSSLTKRKTRNIAIRRTIRGLYKSCTLALVMLLPALLFSQQPSDPRVKTVAQLIIDQLKYNETCQPGDANYVIDYSSGIIQPGCEEPLLKIGNKEEFGDQNQLLSEIKDLSGNYTIVLNSKYEAHDLTNDFADKVRQAVNKRLKEQGKRFTIDLLINVDTKLETTENGFRNTAGLFLSGFVGSEVQELFNTIKSLDENADYKKNKFIHDLRNLYSQRYIRLTELTFSAKNENSFLEIGEKNRPHWKKDENDDAIVTRPACYVRGSQVIVAPKIFISPEKIPENTSKMSIQASYKKGEEVQVINKDAEIVNDNGKQYLLSKKTFTLIEELERKVYMFDPLQITWQVKLEKDGEYFDVGISKNRLYVILSNNEYLLSDLDERFFYFGCKFGAGTTSKEGFLHKIWNNKFEIENNPKIFQNDFGMKGTKQLTYYGDANTTNYRNHELLNDADGQCGAWADLLFDILFYQGFGYDNVKYATFKSILWDNNYYKEHLIVKNWDIPDDGSRASTTHHEINNDDIEYLNKRYSIEDKVIRKNDGTGTYEWVEELNPGKIVKRQPGIPGQGTPNPPSDFIFHSILKISIDGTEKYYDPSYGKIYNNKQEIQTIVVDGFYLILPEDEEVKTTNNIIIRAHPILFRKNDTYKLKIE